jgi:hypothetical protein
MPSCCSLVSQWPRKFFPPCARLARIRISPFAKGHELRLALHDDRPCARRPIDNTSGEETDDGGDVKPTFCRQTYVKSVRGREEHVRTGAACRPIGGEPAATAVCERAPSRGLRHRVQDSLEFEALSFLRLVLSAPL